MKSRTENNYTSKKPLLERRRAPRTELQKHAHEHNRLRGCLSMALAQMRGIRGGETLTGEARDLATQIEYDLNKLELLTRERYDPPHLKKKEKSDDRT